MSSKRLCLFVVVLFVNPVPAPPQVRQHSSAALELAPRSAKALYRRAIALEALGDVPAAAADLRALLQTEPGHAEALSALRRIGGGG